MDLNNVDNQMKLFQEGGIADDGMSRDPVSGNEVPPGSLASEVRDDVDAKLSSGEYVVPADVVRFFGVDYFEKLRKKAKAGLEDMEADGRIGGEPMPEGLGGEDDLPFSDEELMSIEDEEPLEMAEGGAVASKFNPQAFQPGFSFGLGDTGTGATGGVVTKTYRNAAGEIKSVMFVNGQPIQSIPTGFYEDTPENRAKFATPEAATPSAGVASVSTGNEPDGSGGDVGGGGGYTSENVTGLFGDPNAVSPAMADAISQGQLLGGVLGAAKGFMSAGLFGAAIKGYQEAQKGGAKGAENTVAEALATAETYSNLGRNDLAQQYTDIAAQLAKEQDIEISSLQSKAKDIAKEASAAMSAAAPPGMTFGVTSTGELGYIAETGRGGSGRGGVTDVTGTPTGFAPDSIAVTGVPDSVQAAIAAQRGGKSPSSSTSTSGRSGSISDGRGGSVEGASASGGGGGGASSGPGADAGEAGYGGGYGGWAARGMLVDKRVKQKEQPKATNKGLVKRKTKKQ